MLNKILDLFKYKSKYKKLLEEYVILEAKYMVLDKTWEKLNVK